MTDEAKNYEMGYLLSPNLSPDEANQEAQNIKKAVEEIKGLVLEENEPKLRPLAYPISKITEAHFCLLTFSLNPLQLENLEKMLLNNQSVMRYLVTAFKKKQTGGFRPAKKKRISPVIKSEEEKKEESREIDKKLEEILG